MAQLGIKSEEYKKTIRNAQRNFEDICMTILYSDNQKEVALAYDLFFNSFKDSIIKASKTILLSCVEDVIFKILESSAESAEDMTGDKYSPYSRLVALAKRQETINKNDKQLYLMYRKQLAGVYQISNLSKMLMFANISSDDDLDLKNKYLRNAFHKNYIK